MAGKKKSSPEEHIRIVAENRKARYSYEILEQLEAGIVLRVNEMKSMRECPANIRDSDAYVKRGE